MNINITSASADVKNENLQLRMIRVEYLIYHSLTIAFLQLQVNLSPFSVLATADSSSVQCAKQEKPLKN